MAIRPVDLQLAYMSAPANAASVSAALEGPQAAQAAAQAAFAAEMSRRQEHVDDVQKTQGQKVSPDRDQQSAGDGMRDGKRRRNPQDSPGSAAPTAFAGDGEHLIDVMA